MSITLKEKRSACRGCGSSEVWRFLTLPNLPMPDEFAEPGSTRQRFIMDLDIYHCPACGLVQSLQDLDLAEYYSDYQYCVSNSPLVENYSRLLATSIKQSYGHADGTLAIEVGSADGYQLTFFKERGYQVLGIEPSKPLAMQAEENGVSTLCMEFTPDSVEKLVADHGKASVVLSQFTFDHLPDPLSFINLAAAMLHPENGVLVIEVHDLEKIYDRNEACLFTHEHYTYTSTDTLGELCRMAGLRVVSDSLVPEAQRRGNSMLLVATPQDSNFASEKIERRPSLDALREKETYERFARTLIERHEHLAEIVRGKNAAGIKAAGYGASARASNTISLAGLGKEELCCIFDKNASLHGKLLPGSDIPVYGPGEIASRGVDELIVFSYGYMAEIAEDLRSWIEAGGKLISLLELLEDGNT